MSFEAKKSVELIGGDNCSERVFSQAFQRFMDNAELRAQLALRAGGIHLAKALVPEAPPHWQQRPPINDDILVAGVSCPILVSCSCREISPAWRLSKLLDRKRAVGCFWSSTSRVTTSTSASESWMRMRKRSSIFARSSLAGERGLAGRRPASPDYRAVWRGLRRSR